MEALNVTYRIPRLAFRFGRTRRHRAYDRISLLVLLVSLAAPAFAQTPPPAPPPYQSVRSEEDWRYLRDRTRRTDFWDPVKYIPFDEQGHSYLTLGGEARLRFEAYQNPNWGQDLEGTNGYLLQRYMLHADWHPGQRLRVFGQIKSGLEHGRVGGPRPFDKDSLDLHQAFVDVTTPFASNGSLTLRVGRQELEFGSSRLVSTREGLNVRLSFDGLRVMARTGEWIVNAYATKPVKTNPGLFDDRPDPAQTFWGAFVAGPVGFLPGGHGVLYYSTLDRKRARFDRGAAHETRRTLGTRFWGRTAALDYNYELIYQWGGFGSAAIQAWALASDTGYTWHAARFQPRLGYRADLISGDRNPAGRNLRTFNALFAGDVYSGKISLVGPANSMSLTPLLDVVVAKPLTLKVDGAFFWRESIHDAVYGIAGNVQRTGQRSRARFVGRQPSLRVDWNVDRHLIVTAIFAHFFAGPFLRETPPGKDVNYVTAYLTYKF